MKDVLGFEELYKITEEGRLFSVRKQRFLTPSISPNSGYLRIGLYKDSKVKYDAIHRIVAVAFVPNPENKPCVNHKDGNKLNNHYLNLEWCTHSENTQHMLKTGLKTNFICGEVSNLSKLTEEQVLEIRSLSEIGYTQKEISEQFNIHQSLVSCIKNRKIWKHI